MRCSGTRLSAERISRLLRICRRHQHPRANRSHRLRVSRSEMWDPRTLQLALLGTVARVRARQIPPRRSLAHHNRRHRRSRGRAPTVLGNPSASSQPAEMRKDPVGTSARSPVSPSVESGRRDTTLGTPATPVGNRGRKSGSGPSTPTGGLGSARRHTQLGANTNARQGRNSDNTSGPAPKNQGNTGAITRRNARPCKASNKNSLSAIPAQESTRAGSGMTQANPSGKTSNARQQLSAQVSGCLRKVLPGSRPKTKDPLPMPEPPAANITRGGAAMPIFEPRPSRRR